MDTLKKTLFTAIAPALLLAGFTAPGLSQEGLKTRGAEAALGDGTRQGFTIGVDAEGAVHSLELHQSPVKAENAAAAAILIASIADGKPGHALHLRLLPPVQAGEAGSWNLSAFIRKAIQEGRFPGALPPYGRVTVQFLKKSGDIVGPPLSAGELPELAGLPAQSSDTKYASDCGGLECFEERFAKCRTATLTVNYKGGEVYEYEILGKEETGCEVRSGFLNHPDPTWVGKEMTCLLDRAKPFLKAVEDTRACEGPLKKLMAGE